MLLRHQLSCRAAKPDGEDHVSKWTCQRCGMGECSCSAADPQQATGNTALPSPPTDISQARSEGTHEDLSPNSRLSSGAQTQPQGAKPCFESTTSSSYASNLDLTLSGSTDLQWRLWANQEKPNAPPGPSPQDVASPEEGASQQQGVAVADDTSPKERRQPSKRGRYVPQAW